MAQRKTKSKRSLKNSKYSKPKTAAASKKPSPKKAAVPAKRGKAKRLSAVRRKGQSEGAASKPIQLFYWPTPNGHKIAIFLEEARVPYELRPVNIGRGEQFTPEFLKISPNNKMPAIVDPSGPGGRAISIFESGAILRYLGEKTGKFYPADPKGKAKVDEWLFWQVGGLGPMAGQAHHFRNYAKEQIPYAIERYTNEVNRLYGVLDGQFSDGRKFIAGRYSIADMAILPWVVPYEGQGQDLNHFPHLKAWFERMSARPGVKRGLAAGADLRQKALDLKNDEEARKVLFGQRARVA